MEEAPKGTFEDELEWCIQQLETGLLHRNPTTRQVADTQRVLRVLRSRKAPFVKKRQVMNQVFGNYRLKMVEERQKQEQAVNNLPQPNIQEVTSRDTQSVAYRKSSKDVQSGPGCWFTPSDNEFTFNFFPDQECQNTEGGPDAGVEDDAKEIIEETCSTSESSATPQTTHDASGDQHGVNPKALVVAQENTSSLNSSTLGVTANQTEAIEKDTAEPQKKKKKKSKAKNVAAQMQSKVEEGRGNVDSVPPQKEEFKSGADELRRELDWCVEQLEIGLKRQKSTPKQVEEALRAIKTLRSEKVPLVKKRQVMRVMFGDYRHKMEEERVKQLRLMQAASKSAKMIEVTLSARQNSSKVFRKRSHGSARSAAPSSAVQGTDHQTPASSSSNHQDFTFRPSQEAFCFNFF